MECRYLISEEERRYSDDGDAVTFGERIYKCVYDGFCPFMNNHSVECPVKKGRVRGDSNRNGDPLTQLLSKRRRLKPSSEA